MDSGTSNGSFRQEWMTWCKDFSPCKHWTITSVTLTTPRNSSSESSPTGMRYWFAVFRTSMISSSDEFKSIHLSCVRGVMTSPAFMSARWKIFSTRIGSSSSKAPIATPSVSILLISDSVTGASSFTVTPNIFNRKSVDTPRNSTIGFNACESQ